MAEHERRQRECLGARRAAVVERDVPIAPGGSWRDGLQPPRRVRSRTVRVAMPGAPFVANLVTIVDPIVVWPRAPSSVLAPNSKASPTY